MFTSIPYNGTPSYRRKFAETGIYHKTYEFATTVLDKAPIVEATRKKELTINTAYEVTKLPEDKLSEVAEIRRKGKAQTPSVRYSPHAGNYGAGQATRSEEGH